MNPSDEIKPNKIKMDAPIKKSWGGKRPGAGRKPKSNDIIAGNDNLTLRQKKYIKARVDGASQTDAAAKAGYSRGTSASHIENAPSVREAFKRLLGARIPDEKLAQRLAEGLDATETKFFQKDGVVIDSREVVDFKERRAYVQMAGEILEVLPTKDDVDVNVHINHLMNSVPSEWRNEYIVSADDADVLEGEAE